MLTNHYFDVPDERSQDVAVTAVKGALINEGGTHGEAIRAAGVYRSNHVNSNELNLVGVSGGVFSETTVRRFLNDGHVIYIARAQYVYGDRWDGHASTIIGYTSIYSNGVLQYRYMIYDPWPAYEPIPWDSSVITSGQFVIKSYQWICNGRSGLSDDGSADNKVWDRFVVVQTSYSSEIIEPFWNS